MKNRHMFAAVATVGAIVIAVVAFNPWQDAWRWALGINELARMVDRIESQVGELVDRDDLERRIEALEGRRN